MGGLVPLPHIPVFSFLFHSLERTILESNLGSSLFPSSLLYKRGKMSFLINKIRIQRWARRAGALARLRLWGQDSVTSLYVLRAHWVAQADYKEEAGQALLLLCWSAGLSADWLGVLLACKLILCHTPQCSSNRSLSLDQNKSCYLLLFIPLKQPHYSKDHKKRINQSTEEDEWQSSGNRQKSEKRGKTDEREQEPRGL